MTIQLMIFVPQKLCDTKIMDVPNSPTNTLAAPHLDSSQVRVFCGATSIFQTLFLPYQWFTSSARLSRWWSGCNPDQKIEIDYHRRQLGSRFTEETISKIRQKPRTILCDKQQTRQRFLVAEEREKGGDAFRQLTLGQNGDGGIKAGAVSWLATCVVHR